MQKQFPISDLDTILRCIPQRQPIVMVDELIHYTEETLVSAYHVNTQRLFTNTHLTEPGIIEHMAQSVALHTGFSYYLQNMPVPVGYIGSISNLRIKRLPKVGEIVHTTIQILQEFAGITLVNIETSIANEIIASGQMKTVSAQ